MLTLIELLTQMWLARGGGVHTNDDPKPMGFGGSERDLKLACDLTCRQLTDRIQVTTLGGPVR